MLFRNPFSLHASRRIFSHSTPYVSQRCVTRSQPLAALRLLLKHNDRVSNYSPARSQVGRTFVAKDNFRLRYCGHGQQTTARLTSSRFSNPDNSFTISNSRRAGLFVGFAAKSWTSTR